MMTMEKYGVEDRLEQQRAELAAVQRRRAELERANTPLEKSAAASEYAELQRRETELLRSLANQ